MNDSDDRNSYLVTDAGYTNLSAGADGNDEEPDIYEALIDPHDAGGKGNQKGQPNAPMMMPPMMGGVGSAGGGAAGASAAALGAGKVGPGGALGGSAAAGSGAGGLGAGSGLPGGGAVSPGSGGMGALPKIGGSVSHPGITTPSASGETPLAGVPMPGVSGLGNNPGLSGAPSSLTTPGVGPMPGIAPAGPIATPGTSAATVDPVSMPDPDELGKGLDGLTNRVNPNLSTPSVSAPAMPHAGDSSVASGADLGKLPTPDASTMTSVKPSTSMPGIPDAELAKMNNATAGNPTIDTNGDGVPDLAPGSLPTVEGAKAAGLPDGTTPGSLDTASGLPDMPSAEDMPGAQKIPGMPDAPGTPDASKMPGVPDAAGVPGSDGLSNIATPASVDMPNAKTPGVDGLTDPKAAGSGIPDGMSMPEPSVSGGGMPGGGGSLPGGGGMPGGGLGDQLHTNGQDFRKESERWKQYASNYEDQHGKVRYKVLTNDDFYEASELVSGYNELREWLTGFLDGGKKEFTNISSKLDGARVKYEQTEAENAAAAAKAAIPYAGAPRPEPPRRMTGGPTD